MISQENSTKRTHERQDLNISNASYCLEKWCLSSSMLHLLYNYRVKTDKYALGIKLNALKKTKTGFRISTPL